LFPRSRVWALKRTANYGSQHYDEHSLTIQSAQLAADGRTVLLELPGVAPTWCMEIRYELKTNESQPFSGVIHNTIHRLAD
jgi:hypothetical protein